MPDPHHLSSEIDSRVFRSVFRSLFAQLTITASLIGVLSAAPVTAAPREQMIPVLSHVWEASSKGSVDYVVITFDRRADTSGLAVQFKTTPGRFSRSVQTSIEEAIRRTARSLKLSTDSWTVVLTVPYPDITVSGENLYGMVALSVAAMATGRTIDTGLLLTGTITPEGRIGPAGSTPLRVPAPGRARLRRVLVSKEQPLAERDRPARDLMPVTPISSVTQAFQELTGEPPRP
jgi:predicted S18 family serine protease